MNKIFYPLIGPLFFYKVDQSKRENRMVLYLAYGLNFYFFVSFFLLFYLVKVFPFFMEPMEKVILALNEFFIFLCFSLAYYFFDHILDVLKGKANARKGL